MGKTNPSQVARERRKVSIRKRVSGTVERPRLTVFRSASHIYAQVVNDESGHTLVAASTRSPELKELEEGWGDIFINCHTVFLFVVCLRVEEGSGDTAIV